MANIVDKEIYLNQTFNVEMDVDDSGFDATKDTAKLVHKKPDGTYAAAKIAMTRQGLTNKFVSADIVFTGMTDDTQEKETHRYALEYDVIDADDNTTVLSTVFKEHVFKTIVLNKQKPSELKSVIDTINTNVETVKTNVEQTKPNITVY